METKTVFIKKGQKMVDVIPMMITNSIYNKSIPGIGATTQEINANRNSILILPFVPVIIGKEYDKDGRKRPDLLGVYGDKTSDSITKYLESMGDKNKKILCTPEKFNLVKQAILDQGEDLYNNYFLLLDECETMIKDVDFRPGIKLPLDDFFKFKNKAMVSATPIIPRDQRFNRQQFIHVMIKPHRRWIDYRKDIDLIGTNNVVSVLRNYIVDNSKEPICIFTNCAKTISKIISDLNLEKTAKVFCAEKLVIKRFRPTGVEKTYTSWKDNKDGLAEVNFFTGRFFSAVDLITNSKPCVIMVTNIYHSSHSKIDPATDAIQISGRFRNGISQLIHITNFNPDIPLRSKKQLRKTVEELLVIYKFLKSYRDRSDTNDDRVKWINEVFESTPFNRTIKHGKLDTYLTDNLLQNEFVDSYYNQYQNLISAYEKTNYFNVSYSTFNRKVTDQDIMKKDCVTGAKKREAIARMLDNYIRENTPYNLDLSYNKDLNEFKLMDEVVFNAYFDLGLKFMEEANFKLKSLKNGLVNKHKERLKITERVLAKVYVEFKSNQTITSVEAKEQLQDIYDNEGLSLSATGADIKNYFKTTESHSIRRQGRVYRGYRLGDTLYDNPIDFKELNSHIK